ncbi:MAG: DMT family transporter [Rhodospirillaceae bacterium]|jgi:drug/metabolite transporter (DMT)-like permease|nr:DMT family transporter [Rhodospirillaceae bacterium]MBT6117698.1 DMT family transporter [Rhodospirillaceae bacterium]
MEPDGSEGPAVRGHGRGQARDHARGIVLMMLAWSLFPVMDAVSKYISDDYHVLQIVWARFLFQALATLVLLLALGRRRALRTNALRLQILRSGGFLAHTLLFITAIVFIPLAEGIALLFIGPMVVVALSALLLRESVGMARWLTVLTGFAGAMLIIRPGLGVLHWAASLVLLSALCFALYQVWTRGLHAVDSPLTTLAYTPLVGLLALSPVVPFFWAWPSAGDWALMALMGAVGALSHFILIKAFEAAEASLLAPFAYVQIVSAVLLGFVVFGDLPDRWTLTGAAVIIVANLVLIRMDRRGAAPVETP